MISTTRLSVTSQLAAKPRALGVCGQVESLYGCLSPFANSPAVNVVNTPLLGPVAAELKLDTASLCNDFAQIHGNRFLHNYGTNPYEGTRIKSQALLSDFDMRLSAINNFALTSQNMRDVAFMGGFVKSLLNENGRYLSPSEIFAADQIINMNINNKLVAANEAASSQEERENMLPLIIGSDSQVADIWGIEIGVDQGRLLEAGPVSHNYLYSSLFTYIDSALRSIILPEGAPALDTRNMSKTLEFKNACARGHRNEDFVRFHNCIDFNNLLSKQITTMLLNEKIIRNVIPGKVVKRAVVG